MPSNGLPEVWGPAEIAEALEVHPSTVAEWQARADFPEPRRLRMGPVFSADQVRDWYRARVRERRERRAF